MSAQSRDALSTDEAEGLAIDALRFMAGEPEYLARFLAETGIGPDTLRTAASDPGFLAGVLEFVMSDETLLLTFVEHKRIRPTLVAVARHRLDRGAPDR
jgi:hypothetical protein